MVDLVSRQAVEVATGGSRGDFIHVGPDGRPVGYSLDLCLAAVATLADDLNVAALRAEYVRVTAVDRVERVASGAIDSFASNVVQAVMLVLLLVFSESSLDVSLPPPSGGTQSMFCKGSLMSQVLQWTQFCALICRRSSPPASFTNS